MSTDQLSSRTYFNFLILEYYTALENETKFEEFAIRIQEYRDKLDDAVKATFAIKLPHELDFLVDCNFSSIKYLYESNLLDNDDIYITDLSSTDLVKKLALGELTSVRTLMAFGRRAAVCHQLTNCSLQFFVEEGMKRASYLDDYFKTHNKTIGPLHGLPISLKEHLGFKGKLTHGSFVALMDTIPKQHGITVKILEDLGAVFYTRTNEPQTMMLICSANPLIGVTRNPYNLRLTLGGSSSGEGSLVSFGGSPLGVGSDIGGSVRVPAAFSGCNGFKPTTRRLSTHRDFPEGNPPEGILHVVGPLARKVEDLELFMRSYINNGKPWLVDQFCVPLEWREVNDMRTSNITIGIMWDNGLIKPTPPIKRALSFVEEKLRKAGFSIVKFEPMKIELFWDCLNRLYDCDDNFSAHKLLQESGEPIMKSTKPALAMKKQYSLEDYHNFISIRNELRQLYTDFMVSEKIDFILGPVCANVAALIQTTLDITYSGLYNFLDFPALSFQTGLFQDPIIDKWEDEHGKYQFRSQLEKYELGLYDDPSLFENAPIGLQLAGRRYCDEEVLACGKIISNILS